jgi:hypothetical protein
MKTALLLVLASLLSGCMSPQAVSRIVDEKIAANNSAFFQPALAKQQAELVALAAEMERNQTSIGEAKEMISKHRGVLLDAFRAQQRSAEAAIRLLAPASEPPPIAVPQTAPVE